jgi:two-component system, NtrC family, response regulator HydG
MLIQASTDRSLTQGFAMNTHLPSILVVDDDVDTCQNLSDILTDFGYDVDTAYNGPAALQRVREKPYDIALLDFKMPGMDGLTVYREIRKLRSATVAMIVTAYATSETRQEALQAGTWQVLSKPVVFPKLLSLVEEIARQPLVMVVDDDHELCDALWDLLRERGYRVALAHDQQEAGERLQEKDFQIVLVDLKLPGGDGRQVLDLIREMNPQARTVLITGHRSELELHVQQAVQEGADAVCYKPFDIPKLLNTLKQFSRTEENVTDKPTPRG